MYKDFVVKDQSGCCKGYDSYRYILADLIWETRFGRSHANGFSKTSLEKINSWMHEGCKIVSIDPIRFERVIMGFQYHLVKTDKPRAVGYIYQPIIVDFTWGREKGKQIIEGISEKDLRNIDEKINRGAKILNVSHITNDRRTISVCYHLLVPAK